MTVDPPDLTNRVERLEATDTAGTTGTGGTDTSTGGETDTDGVPSGRCVLFCGDADHCSCTSGTDPADALVGSAILLLLAMRRVRRFVGAAILVLVCTPACSGDSATVAEADAARVLAEKFCEAWAACDCPENFATCEADLTASLQAGFDMDKAAGGVYDASCVTQTLAEIDALGCAGIEALGPAYISECGEECSIYSGQGTAGSPCEAHVDCDGSLRCLDGTCQDICTWDGLAQDGEPCADKMCTWGLFCLNLHPDPADWTCARLRGEGEDCGATIECASGDCVDGFCTKPTPAICR